MFVCVYKLQYFEILLGSIWLKKWTPCYNPLNKPALSSATPEANVLAGAHYICEIL